MLYKVLDSDDTVTNNMSLKHTQSKGDQARGETNCSKQGPCIVE